MIKTTISRYTVPLKTFTFFINIYFTVSSYQNLTRTQVSPLNNHAWPTDWHCGRINQLKGSTVWRNLLDKERKFRSSPKIIFTETVGRRGERRELLNEESHLNVMFHRCLKRKRYPKQGRGGRQTPSAIDNVAHLWEVVIIGHNSSNREAKNATALFRDPWEQLPQALLNFAIKILFFYCINYKKNRIRIYLLQTKVRKPFFPLQSLIWIQAITFSCKLTGWFKL